MKLTMQLGVRSYDIIIKRGSLGRMNQLVHLDRKVLVVTDSGVPVQYVQQVAAQCAHPYIVTVPQGEDSKSLEVWQQLLHTMLEKGFGRGDAVMAVGGGVVGDLAGFAAASYMRGIDFINLPTTTLAQIDSSIGGKTAINFENTKNIVGAFWQPRLVIVDPDVLSTLPPRHFAAGLAEAVKAGLLADSELFRLFEEEDYNERIEEVIYRSLIVKKNIVERDENEKGDRAALNLGHTIGHGIEIVPPLLTDFFLQGFVNLKVKQDSGLVRRRVPDGIIRWLYGLVRRRVARVDAVAARFRYYEPFMDIFDEAAGASRVVTLDAQFGEGWVLPGEIMSLAHRGIAVPELPLV